MNYVGVNVDSLEDRVTSIGDTSAYILLQTYFIEAGPIIELGYDYIMATKYKYPPASYHLAQTLMTINGIDLGTDSTDISGLDLQTRLFILQHLILYNKYDSKDSILTKIKFYKDFTKEKNLIYALSMLNLLDSVQELLFPLV